MIIQQKKEAVRLDSIHSRIFEASSMMLSASAGTSKPSNIPYFAKTFFISLVNILMLTTPHCKQIWNCAPIDRLYDISKYFGPMLVNTIGIEYFILVLYCLFGWIILSILSQIYAFIKPKDMKNYLSLLFYSTRLFRLLLAPILTMILQGVLQPIGTVFNICSATIFILLISHLVSFRIFSFNPIPKNNQFYQLSGSIGCLQVIITGTQTVLLSQGPTISTYIVLSCLYTALEIYRSHQLISWTLSTTAGLPSLTVVIFCIFTAVAGMFPNTSETLFYLFCLTLPIYWSYKIIQLHNIPLNDFYLSDCSTASTLQICRFVRCLWELEDFFVHAAARDCMIQFLSQHQLNCRQAKCPISKQKIDGLVFLDTDSNSSVKTILENYALFILQLRSFMSPTLQCLYFIQLFLKSEAECIATLKLKKILNQPANLKFILFHLQRIGGKDVVAQTTAINNDNFSSKKEQFINSLKETLGLYCRLFYELRCRSLNLAAFQEIGDACYERQTQLRSNFQGFLKNQRLCLEVIEFYMQFLNSIQGDTETLRSLIQSILRIKMLNKYQDFQIMQCPNACLEIKEDMTIGNVNMQACKIFGSSKLEIIDKPLSQFMVPVIQKDDLDDVMLELEKTPLLCFLLTRQGLHQVCRLKSRKKKTAKGSQQFLQIYPQKLLSNVCFALADNHGALIQSSRLKLVDDSDQDILIDDLFRDYIIPSWTLLIKQQQMNMDYESGSINIVLSPTIQQTIYCLRIDMTPHTSRIKDTYCHQPPYFKFRFNVENDRIVAEGGPVNQTNFTLSEIQNRRISLMLEASKNYGVGIRTYRLQGDRIISTELQRDIDGRQFVKCEEAQDLSRSFVQKMHSSNILRGTTLLISLLLLSAVFSRVYLQNSTLTLINQTYSKYIHIQMFQIRYYWSACIMRDADFGFIASDSNLAWTAMVSQLIGQMQQVRKQRLYSQQAYDIVFNGVNYKTSLDEVYNIIIAHMLQAIQQNSTEISQTIHYLTVRELRTYSQKQMRQITHSIEMNLQKIKQLSWLFLIILTLLTGFLLITLLLIQYAEIKIRGEMLISYRMMSDKEIESYIVRFRNFDTLLTLYQKNLEVEIYGCFEETEQFQKRSRIKNVKAKLQERKKFLLFLLLVFCVCSTVYFLGHEGVAEITQSMHTSFILNRAIGQSYSNYIFLSIDAENVVDEATVNSTFSSLSMIQQNKDTLPFTQQFSRYIRHIYFEDCCDAVKQLTPNINCQNFSSLNRIKNPFQFGLVSFLYHTYYQILEDIEETVSSTGIQATAFTRIARHLISKTEEQWNLIINNASSQEKRFIVLQILVLGLLVGLMVILKRQNQQARSLVAKICELINMEKEVAKQQQVEEESEMFRENNNKKIKFEHTT